MPSIRTLLVRTMFAPAMMLGVLAFTIPLAQAQLTYTYQGNRLNGYLADADPIHGQAITAKLITDEIIPSSTALPGHSTSQPCPKTWTFTITLGNAIYDSQKSAGSSCYYAGNDGNHLLPAFLSLVVSQGEDTRTEVGICAYPNFHAVLPNPTCAREMHGTAGGPVARQLIYDWAGQYTFDESGRKRAVGNAPFVAYAEPGRWSPPKPAEIAAGLLTRLTAMNIQEQGTSLVAQITSVQSDINDGSLDRACTDLRASVDHVKAQTGKAISPADATASLRWLDYISAGIPCSGK